MRRYVLEVRAAFNYRKRAGFSNDYADLLNCTDEVVGQMPGLKVLYRGD
jgi:hypothetical protein